MDDKSFGLGAFKFQSVVSNEMKVTKDINQLRRSRILQIQPSVSAEPTGEVPKPSPAIAEKSKKSFQNATKKVQKKLLDPREKEKFEEDLKRIPVSLFEENENTATISQDKKKEQFVLAVSASSEDENLSDTDNDDDQERLAKNKELLKKSEHKQDVQARSNIRSMMSNKFSQSLSNSKPSPRQSLSELKKKDPPKVSLTQLKLLKGPPVKREIQLLRSLFQNQNLQNNENLRVDEYKQDREILVDMDCKEIMTFMRLQHEVEELRRKQMDFSKQKERHYQLTEKAKKQNKADRTKLDIKGIMLAKRFAKTMKDKRKQQSHKSIALTKKSTLYINN